VPFLFCGAWSQERAKADLRFPALVSWIEAGITAANFNNDEAAEALGINDRGSALSNMREFRTSGPGVLRFAAMPPAFWRGFIGAAAKHYCLRVIDEPWVDKVIARINLLQVAILGDDEQKRMAKSQLRKPCDNRKRA
jgi:hypothetical protein